MSTKVPRTLVAALLFACACSNDAKAPRLTPTIIVGGAGADAATKADTAGQASLAFPERPPSLPVDAAERHCTVATYDYKVRAAVAENVPPLVAALPLGKCFGTTKGAWSLSLEVTKKKVIGPNYEGNVGGYAVVHVDANDRVARRVTKIAYETDRSNLAVGDDGREVVVHQGGGTSASAFDFDADGDNELYVEWTTYAASTRDDAPSWTDSELLTFKSDRIMPYAPAAKMAIWGLEDVDKDGRPDLQTSSPYSERQRRGQWPLFTWDPHFVAHSLGDGTFSMTDAVAMAAARVICPKKPTAKEIAASANPVTGSDHMPSEDVALFGCARLWGLSAEAVEKAYARSVKDRPELETVLRVEPPLTLR